MMHLLLAALALAAGPDSLLVSPAWLSARLGDPRLVVIHADRDRTTFDAGHIAGSRFLPLAAIVVERAGVPNELPPVAALDSALEAAGVGDSTVVVITGDPLAAARLFFTLDYLGHSAAILDGGTPGWVAAGFPVGTAPEPTTRGALTPAPRSDIVVDAAWVRSHLGDSAVALLDARPPADFAGTPGSTPPTGHIPGAKNIFWRTTLGGAPPVLLGRGALEGMFAAADAPPSRLVVTYCRTGVQASWLYFVARYLGREVRMYDGSFAEWSTIPGAPVAQ